MAFGASTDLPYLWSTRELIVLPVINGGEPEIVRVDRIDFGEVVSQARWSRGVLHLLDEVGAQCQVRVQGARLAVDSD